MHLFERAVAYAAEKHDGQRRKLSTLPYILHPLEVAEIVGTMTDSEDALAAAVLHDTVEDTDATIEDIERLFGRRVALIVMTDTENKRDHLPPEATWRVRKEETLCCVENTKDEAVKMLWLGDKLANMRSFYREYQKRGDALWQSFHQHDPKEQAWYYRTVAKSLSCLSHTEAYKEYVRLMNIVFQNVEEEK